MSSTFEITADFDCPLDQLWAFVSHVPNQDRWVFGMSDSALVGEGPIGVGSEIVGTSTERGRSLRVTMMIREFDPPRRVCWENTDGHTPFRTEITCSGDDASSRLRYQVTLYPSQWLMKLVMGPLRPLGRVVANRMLREEIAQLRAALAERA